MQIGKAIKTLRKERNISQSELSKKSGISQVYLSQIETGTRSGTINMLETIAKGLQIPLPVIFWLAIEQTDIEESKQGIYIHLKPVIDSMIKQII